ncbi:hypothetical protein LJC07_04515, partial [Christensenellaceae bacterium OttesenSCG-928-L17]|nr:hypothetical protein [Christensenellaceae bacterium OttesenSCG-928-L17]
NFTVLHCNDGELETQTAVYADGGVTTTWEMLSPFAVASAAGLEHPGEDELDPPKTGDAEGLMGVLLVLLAGCGMACVWRLRRRKG